MELQEKKHKKTQKNPQRLQDTENLFRKNLQLKDILLILDLKPLRS